MHLESRRRGVTEKLVLDRYMAEEKLNQVGSAHEARSISILSFMVEAIRCVQQSLNTAPLHASVPDWD
jgi:hypothetical protein